MKNFVCNVIVLLFAVGALSGCGGHGAGEVWRDQNMDFTAIQTVAVMPFANLTRDSQSGDRVRDVFIPMLMETGSVYVLPPGEVYRALLRINVANPTAPSAEETIALANSMKVNAVITGVVREYGEVRSGSAEANIISLSLQMLDGQTGRVVWTGSTTKGGVTLKDRLLGGGGSPMNDVTEKALNDLLDKLFR